MLKWNELSINTSIEKSASCHRPSTPKMHQLYQITIASWNAQGLSNPQKQTELRFYLRTNDIDILLLQETFLNWNHKLFLPNFKIHRVDRASHGGGVAIAVRQGINFKVVPNTKTKLIEHCSISIRCRGRETKITSAYAPRYSSDLKNDIGALLTSSTDHIIMGDCYYYY